MFVVALLLSGVLLFSPSSGLPPLIPGIDGIAHLLMFAALASTGRWSGLRTAPLVVGLLVYAATSELAQGALPIGRTGDPTDALLDAAGVAVGLLGLRLCPAARVDHDEP